MVGLPSYAEGEGEGEGRGRGKGRGRGRGRGEEGRSVAVHFSVLMCHVLCWLTLTELLRGGGSLMVL